jgi:uncharacterized damage-inducible protein DinB
VTTLIQRTLEPVSGCASRLGGLFLAQLDDQTRRLTLVTRDLTAEELAWQPALGQNTIGMLLAHIARVEVDWISFGLLKQPMGGSEVMALTDEEIGMPLAADGKPPAALAGRTLESFDDWLAHARAFTKATVAPLTDETLATPFRLPWDDGEIEANASFVLYHVLAHYALHRGQIHLLRHQYRDRSRG